MKLSVVIPVYGCREALEELYERLVKSLNEITNDYEIILVNDCCPQNSIEIIQKICDKDKRVIGIELSRNFGQMKAILAGLEHSTGDWVVVMDCDLQDRPEEIINLYNKTKEGYDVVFARKKKRKDNFFKILISKIFYKIYSFATDVKYDSTLCNFSIINRKVVDSYCKMREEHRAYVIYIQWLGFKQTAIDVENDKRKAGKSSYNFKKRFKMAMDIIFSQSDKVLKAIVFMGFLITLISLIAVLVIVVNYFIHKVAEGWSSIIATMCLMSGIIIFTVGIVGIYIGNIFVQSKNRPLYIIRNIFNEKEEKENEQEEYNISNI